MKEVFNLTPFSRYKDHIREFTLLEDHGNSGIYDINAKWDDGSEMPIRLGYDKVESGILDFVDFDGGPFVTPGFELEPNIKVEKIVHNGEFKDIRVIITNGISD